jgi:hypothetical protein
VEGGVETAYLPYTGIEAVEFLNGVDFMRQMIRRERMSHRVRPKDRVMTCGLVYTLPLEPDVTDGTTSCAAPLRSSQPVISFKAAL